MSSRLVVGEAMQKSGPARQESHALRPRTCKRKRSLAIGASTVGVACLAGFAAWGAGMFETVSESQLPAAITRYDIKASASGGDPVDSAREAPLVLESAGAANDLIRDGMEWQVVITNQGAATGRLFFVLCDPTSSKIKYRIAPGKDEVYPDLFTQLRFTVTDEAGTVVIEDAMVGADENHEPQGDGTVRGDITRVLEANGGEAVFTIKAVFDYDANDLTKTKLAAYTGVNTDFGIRVEGESF